MIQEEKSEETIDVLKNLLKDLIKEVSVLQEKITDFDEKASVLIALTSSTL